MARNDMIDVEDLTVVRSSGAAILVKDPDGNEVWLPRSQIEWPEEEVSEPGDIIIVAMPEWLAEAKGLI
jgi:hypothetical protein